MTLSSLVSDGLFRGQRQLSSTDLLKSLLEEPIKRSWLCRSTCNSSTDEQSDNSQKSPHSGSEGEQLERFLISMPGAGHDKLKSYASNWSAVQAGQTGLSNAILMQKSAKPDLPGRVSFSKPNTLQHDADSSDCDNDKQELRGSSISAPGPLTLPSFSYLNNATASKSESSIDANAASAAAAAAAQKKSVHFGAPVAGSGSAEVLAETYEYPKCPSENCTCSTRSSSTASTNEAATDTKCACDAPSCRYADSTSPLDLALAAPLPQKAATPELNVIREYKQAVAVPLEQLVAKTKPLEPLHNLELPNYLDKYAAQIKEKQNNLSDKNLSVVHNQHTNSNSSINSCNNNSAAHTNSNTQVHNNSQANSNSHVNNNSSSLVNSSGAINSNRGSAQRNFGAENNFLPLVQDERRHYSANSSESVISNYLKVATTTPTFVGKKKENVKPASAETNTTRQQKPARFHSKTSSSGSCSTAGKLKKAVSVGSLREERKLNEYNLDKVDSWMSMQEQKQALAQFEELHKQGLDELEDSVSLKSNDEEEEDSRGSTYDEIVSVIKEIEEDKKRGVYEQGVSNATG